jgi:hypothetical protein
VKFEEATSCRRLRHHLRRQMNHRLKNRKMKMELKKVILKTQENRF